MPDTRPLIAHVVFRFAVGGLENGVVNLVNRMSAERWRHAVIALDEVADAMRARVQRTDVQYVALRKAPGHLLPLYPRLVRLFRQLGPAIVHTRNLAALEATVPAALARVPVRVHGEHGWDVHDMDGSNRRYRLVRRLYRPFVHRYVALSRQIEDYLRGSVGVPAVRISQIYNGVDTGRFFPRAAGGDRPDGWPFWPEDWVVGTVGRLESVKNQVLLARAFVRALQADPAAARRMRLVIAGDGSGRSEIERVLAEGGVSQFAWLPGERSDVPELLRSFDLFCLPSRSEGISNTILEAMASGLPVVATRVGGNAELVEDRATGHLIAAEDEAALAETMLSYFRDAAMTRRHGEAGRSRIEQRFSLDAMVRNYDAMYAAQLEQRGVVAARLSRA